MTGRHVMIRASAGSGKTYALTNRFVSLLAAGARPERIVALTFTRKAAGEFFDEILNKVARAASSDTAALSLAREIRRPGLGRAEFVGMLRSLIRSIPQLKLGTFDGFFARIARAFPFELGLSGDFEVLQEHAGYMERRRVLQRIFARRSDGLEEGQRDFVEAFKRATFGADEKRLTTLLDEFLDSHHDHYLAAPRADLWAEPRRIWPEGCEWLSSQRGGLSEAVARLQGLLSQRDLTPGQRGRWDAFFAAALSWSVGANLPRALEYVFQNALEVWPDICAGSAAITIDRKKITLRGEECAELRRVLTALIGARLALHLEMTRGIYAVLHGYESIYHNAVRREGRLTFSDVQRLLQPDGPGAWLTDGNTREDRLALDYRLDGQFDHWLLDEFQDTSFGQWTVLRSLIDEAVQDATGERSFFCVGDVKQAIYAWREGDARLFGDILDRYTAAAPGAVTEQHLVESWRSGPAIIEQVNSVFGDAAAIAELLPGQAGLRWNAEWRDHSTARPNLVGQAAWLWADTEEARFATTVELLRELAPLERNLDCAVLVRKNSTATELADVLRRSGIPALSESDLHIATDNPLGAALLALLKAAAHPGDTFAHEHVLMTPLAAALKERTGLSPEAITGRVLSQIHSDGFESTLEFWAGALEPSLEQQDVFTRERARQLVRLAALFDQTGSRDVAEFLAFAERQALAGVEVEGVVRVMTIHKSKGLGFDVVVLPDLEGQRIDQAREGLAVRRAPDRSVEWVLDLPPSLFCSPDATLMAYIREAEATAGYEALSLLYVALTRAKRAQYVVTKPPGNTTSRNYPRLLAATLGEEERPIAVGSRTFRGAWTAGDGTWHERIVPVAAVDASKFPPTITTLIGASRRRPVRRPARRASEKGGAVPIAHLFTFDAPDAALFGDAVHSLLAAVEFRETFNSSAWPQHGNLAAALAEASACINAPELVEIWSRRERREVWRERAFEIILDGAWVTGVFDRVLIDRGPDGRARRVQVIDFKTDRVASDTARSEAGQRHAAQLNLYRRVAATLTQVAVTDVEAVLVFTHAARAVAVGPG